MATASSGLAQAFLKRLEQKPCFGGLDLASVSDLTSFGLAWPEDDAVLVHSWFFIPEDGLAERSIKEGVPYDQWVADGWVETTPGAVTDWRFVTQRIKDLAQLFDIREVGFDRYGARDTAADLNESGLVVADVGQSFLDMSAPTKRLQELVLSRKLFHCGHPTLRWNVDCCVVAQDATANLKPVKPDTRKTSKRIDGVVALIMAISRALVNGAIGYSEPEVW